MFCDLVETESFTRAARVNGVSQSAVSQQISALESLFQSPLIERSRKNFRLTPEGRAAYEHGRQIIRTYKSLYILLTARNPAVKLNLCKLKA